MTMGPKFVSPTWSAQLPVPNAADILSALRAAGLPLAVSAPSDGDSDDSDASAMVCLAEVADARIWAIVACPNGLVFRFEPPVYEPAFWSFAAQYYYWVTGNMADRQKVSELAGIPVKSMKGRCLSRAKSPALSRTTLDALLQAHGIGLSDDLFA